MNEQNEKGWYSLEDIVFSGYFIGITAEGVCCRRYASVPTYNHDSEQMVDLPTQIEILEEDFKHCTIVAAKTPVESIVFALLNMVRKPFRKLYHRLKRG